MKLKLFVLFTGLLIFALTFLAGIHVLYGQSNRAKSFSHLSHETQGIQPDHKPPSYTVPPRRESVTLDDGVHIYHLNLSLYQEEFPYLQSYPCSPVLTPKTQHEASKSFIVLAIKSQPKSVTRRQVLRQTWAREWQLDGYELRTIFLMGHTDVSGHMEIVKAEGSEYGDVLQWDFSEGHYNLSLKERCFLEWIFYQLPQVTFIFKGDDDEYVNPPALVKYIRTFASNPRVLHGYLRPHSEVMRFSKYKVSKYIYPGNIYPNFLSGGGFLFSGPAAKVLYTKSQKMPVFPLDDVYFGFLALAANLSFRHDSRFHVYGLEFEVCSYQRALVVHGMSPEQLVERWSKVQNARC